MNARICEVKYEDGPAVFRFLLSQGRGAGGEDAWMRRWQLLYKENPELNRGIQHPIGWIIEGNNNEIGGYIGNIMMPYAYEGREYIGAALTDVAVDEKYRTHSIGLFKEYIAQKNADMLINSTANDASGRVFDGLKIPKLPRENYDTLYYFLIRPVSVFRVFLGRRMPPLIAIPVSAVISVFFFLWAYFWDMRFSGRFAGETVYESGPEGLDGRYDSFWAEMRKEKGRLMVARTREQLQWHFGNARFFFLYRGDILTGYAIADIHNEVESGLRRVRLADIVVRADDSAAIKRLMAAVYAYGKNIGADLIVAYFLPQSVRRVLDSVSHMRRKRDGGVYMHISDSELSAVDSKSLWYATCIDGDSSLGNLTVLRSGTRARSLLGLFRTLKRHMLWGGHSRNVYEYMKIAERTGSPWAFELKSGGGNEVYVNLSFDLELALNGQFWRGEFDAAIASGCTALSNVRAVAALLNSAGAEYNVQLCTGLLDRKLGERPFFSPAHADCIRTHPELFSLHDDILSEFKKPTVETGVHSFSHRNFGVLAREEAEKEIEASIAVYKDVLGTAPAFMAFPDNTVRYADILARFSLPYRAGDNTAGPSRMRLPNGLYWAPLSVSPRDLRSVLEFLRSRKRPAFLHLWQHFTETDAQTVEDYLTVLKEFRCKIVTAGSFFSLCK